MIIYWYLFSETQLRTNSEIKSKIFLIDMKSIFSLLLCSQYGYQFTPELLKIIFCFREFEYLNAIFCDIVYVLSLIHI